MGLSMATLVVNAQRIVTKTPVINVGKTGFEVPVTATFELRNRGSRHLTIREVKTDCGCTQVDYPKKPATSSKQPDARWKSTSIMETRNTSVNITDARLLGKPPYR